MEKRSYQQHGLSALRNALGRVAQGDEWLDTIGDAGKALRQWRDALIADLGGDLSTQERAIVELATRGYLLIESIDRWLLAQPSLVNKSRRALFPVVVQRQSLADGLARHLQQLGLRRRVRPLPTLTEYIASQDGLEEQRSVG